MYSYQNPSNIDQFTGKFLFYTHVMNKQAKYCMYASCDRTSKEGLLLFLTSSDPLLIPLWQIYLKTFRRVPDMKVVVHYEARGAIVP